VQTALSFAHRLSICGGQKIAAHPTLLSILKQLKLFYSKHLDDLTVSCIVKSRSQVGCANSIIVYPPFVDMWWAENRCPPYLTQHFKTAKAVLLQAPR